MQVINCVKPAYKQLVTCISIVRQHKARKSPISEPALQNVNIKKTKKQNFHIDILIQSKYNNSNRY